MTCEAVARTMAAEKATIVLESMGSGDMFARPNWDIPSLEFVVEACFDHLNVGIRRDIVCPGDGESPIRQGEIVVFDLAGPVVRERVFEARAQQPATVR